MKTPLANTSKEAVALRQAASAYAENTKAKIEDDFDKKGQRLNRALLSAALNYANHDAHQQDALNQKAQGISPLEQETTSNAICQHRFVWCRARLLHALAGAAEQGVLLDVLDELLGDHQDADEVGYAFKRALLKSGWMKDGKP